jgi:thiol-disulfide isomerase/thioredoxin
MGGVKQIDSLLAGQQGRWILINVWATWCRPCVAETPELVGLSEQLKDRPFSLIGISADYMTSPSPEVALKKVRDFGVQYRIRYPNVIFSGSTDDLTTRFSLGGTIPTSILFDPQGKEIERWTGRLVDGDFARIMSLVI